MEHKDLASKLEISLLKPDVIRAEVEDICTKAQRYGLYGICLHSSWINLAAYLLEESPVKVIAMVGYPLGATDPDVKRYETEVAIDNGANEIALVINLGFIRDREEKKLFKEIQDVIDAAETIPVGVVIESGLMTHEEKLIICEIAVSCGVYFIQTNIGYEDSKVIAQDIRLIRDAVGPDFCIKASSRIRSLSEVEALLEAGANRIESPEAVFIMEEYRKKRFLSK